MLDHPEKYGLPQGISRGPDKQVYGATMFHQIHCLVCNLPTQQPLTTTHTNKLTNASPIDHDP
jgi:hypothetical protein